MKSLYTDWPVALRNVGEILERSLGQDPIGSALCPVLSLRASVLADDKTAHWMRAHIHCSKSPKILFINPHLTTLSSPENKVNPVIFYWKTCEICHNKKSGGCILHSFHSFQSASASVALV